MKTLKIEDLSKNFGSTEVLKKINLEIDEGNFLEGILFFRGSSERGSEEIPNVLEHTFGSLSES